MEDKVNVEFGKWIEQGFNIYKERFPVLFVPALLTVLLGTLTLGVLSGPMMVGMNLIALRLIDRADEDVKIEDVFQGFQYFVPSFLFTLVWGLAVYVAMFILSFVPCIGGLIDVILGFVVPAFLMFGLFLIPDQKLDFWTASVRSFEKVKSNVWPFLGLSVVAGILGSIGGILCGIGVALTLPLYSLIIGIAYRNAFGPGGETAAEGAVEPTTPGAPDVEGGPEAQDDAAAPSAASSIKASAEEAKTAEEETQIGQTPSETDSEDEDKSSTS